MSTETPKARLVGRGRINVGASVCQDHSYGCWPATASGKHIDPDTIFDVEWDGYMWECIADGFGRRSWLGERGGYGNGAFHVARFSGVTLIGDDLGVEQIKTRSQKMREAGYTRRPSAKSLPSDE